MPGMQQLLSLLLLLAAASGRGSLAFAPPIQRGLPMPARHTCGRHPKSGVAVLQTFGTLDPDDDDEELQQLKKGARLLEIFGVDPKDDEDLKAMVNSGALAFDKKKVIHSAEKYNITKETIMERSWDVLYNPRALSTDLNLKELPMEVLEAILLYYVTGSVDAVEKVCESNEMKLHVRDMKDDASGLLCVLDYWDKEDSENRTEYYLVPIKQVDQDPYLSVVAMNRTDIPFNWKAIGAIIWSQSVFLGIGVFASLVLKIANYGFGKSFSMNGSVLLSNFISVKTAIGVLFKEDPVLCIPAIIISFLVVYGIVNFIFDDDEDEDEEYEYVYWLNKIPRATLSTLRMSIGVCGTRKRPLAGLLASFVVGACPGVAEELLFRGCIQSILTERFGSAFALPCQAILFGLLHFGYKSKLYIVVTSVEGFILGGLYSLTGNLALPMLLHAGSNMLAKLLSYDLVTSMTAYEIETVLRLAPREHFQKEEGRNPPRG